MALPERLFHLGDPDRLTALVASGDDLVDPSLESEGFVHCSFLSQLEGTAGRHFAHAAALAAIEVDPTAVTSELIVEDSYGSGAAYPHVYGPIDAAALGEITILRRVGEGWRLPR